MTNKTLRHLDLDFQRDKYSGRYYSMFADVLHANFTLSSLHLYAPEWSKEPEEETENNLKKFSEALAANQTLTSLTINKRCFHHIESALKINESIRTIKVKSPDGANDDEKEMMQQTLASILQANESITAADLHGVQEFIDIVQKPLLRNYRNYWRSIDDIRNINAFIQMIRLREDAFTDVFPLEIWVKIFKRIHFPYCKIDFARKLLIALDKPL